MEKKQMPPYCLPEGTCLRSRYRIKDILGEGGFGITYRGWDEIFLIPVAIKEYYPRELVRRKAVHREGSRIYTYEGAMPPEYQKGLQAFLQEAQNLAKYDRLEGVAVIRDYFAENGTAYIVMEYIEGNSVEKYIQDNGPMTAAGVRYMLQPVWEALQVMHRDHLIHRDVSADNLLITGKGKIKLVDFGSARSTQHLDHTMTVMYKRGFAPEEQYRTKGEIGPWSDIYSICAVMYYMLSGKMPEEAAQRLVRDHTVPLAQMEEIDLPVGWSEAIEKGMAVMAQDRFQSMEELMTALGEVPLELSDEKIDYRKGRKDSAEPENYSEWGKDPLTTEMIKRELKEVSKAQEKQKSKRKKTMAAAFMAAVIVAVAGAWLLGQQRAAGGADDQTKAIVSESPEGTAVNPDSAEPSAGSSEPVNVHEPGETTDRPAPAKKEKKKVSATPVAAKKAKKQKTQSARSTTGRKTAAKKTTDKRAVQGTSLQKNKKSTAGPTPAAKKRKLPERTKAAQIKQKKKEMKKKEKDNVVGSLDAVLGE